jgi:hypothetical protein
MDQHRPHEKLKVKKIPACCVTRSLIWYSKRADITQILLTSQCGPFHNVFIYFLKLDIPLRFYSNSLTKVRQTRLHFNLSKIIVNKTIFFHICVFVFVLLFFFLTIVLFMFLYCITWWQPSMAETCTDYKNKYCFYNDEILCWLYYFKYAESLQHNGMPLLKNNYIYCI